MTDRKPGFFIPCFRLKKWPSIADPKAQKKFFTDSIFCLFFSLPPHDTEKAPFGLSRWNEWYNIQNTIPIVDLDGPRPSDRGGNAVALVLHS